MKPLNKTSTVWSSKLAYIIGLIASDGNLSSDRRHIIFVSKDLDQVKTFKRCLKLNAKISQKKGGYNKKRIYFYIQFSDVNFYRFLVSIGLTPAKSKTLGKLNVPDKYFFDFLRGSFDGDGSFHSYWDKRWASSHLYYFSLISASMAHLSWIRSILLRLCNIKGHINTNPNSRAYQLKYAKTEAAIIIENIYKNPKAPKLERKYKKVYTALATEAKHNSARVL